MSLFLFNFIFIVLNSSGEDERSLGIVQVKVHCEVQLIKNLSGLFCFMEYFSTGFQNLKKKKLLGVCVCVKCRCTDNVFKNIWKVN